MTGRGKHVGDVRTPRWIVWGGVAVLALVIVVVAALARILGSETDGGEVTTSISMSTTTETDQTAPSSSTIPQATTSTVPVTIPLTDVDARVAPGESIQDAADSVGEGATILIRSGRHEAQTVIPLDGQTFVGESGTILDGIGETSYAFIGRGANDVTIARLEILGYVPPLFEDGNERQVFSHGAITSLGVDGRPTEEGRNWTVMDLDVHNNTAGVFLGDGGVIRNSHIHNNDQIGVKILWAHSALVEGNEISYNNVDRFYSGGYEAGGAKFAWTTDLVVRNNIVHHNGGPGLWTDIDNVNTLYEGNTVFRNAREGIHHEISYSARIINNTVTANGFEGPGWMFGAGILIFNSSDVHIEGNDVRGNYNGIGVIQQDRGSGEFGPWVVTRLTVVDNVVATAGWTGVVEDYGAQNLFDPMDIVFENNTYVFTEGARFQWEGRLLTWATWQDAGHDANGSFSVAP